MKMVLTVLYAALYAQMTIGLVKETGLDRSSNAGYMVLAFLIVAGALSVNSFDRWLRYMKDLRQASPFFCVITIFVSTAIVIARCIDYWFVWISWSGVLILLIATYLIGIKVSRDHTPVELK